MNQKEMTKPINDFNIKLLSGNNVVLVEAQGYDTEIFVPFIENGRINFHNIIPNRRCCQCYIDTTGRASRKGVSVKPTKMEQKWPFNGSNFPIQSSQHSTQHTSSQFIPNTRPSIAFNTKMHRMTAGEIDTAAATNNSEFFHKQSNFANKIEDNVNLKTSRLTPDVVRQSTVPSPYEVIKDTMSKIPSSIKLVRLYCNPSPETPENLGRIVNMGDGSKSVLANTEKSFSFENPSGPLLPSSPTNRRRRKSTVRQPTISSLQKQVSIQNQKRSKLSNPMRTYIRVKQKFPRSLDNSRDIYNDKYMPPYVHNPAQGFSEHNLSGLHRRKLVIDKGTQLPSSVQKKQIRITHDPNSAYQFHLPTTRSSFLRNKYTTYDLLTNPCVQYRNMSKTLLKDYRNNYASKASQTCTKYKNFGGLPPLELDDETRNLLARSKNNPFPNF